MDGKLDYVAQVPVTGVGSLLLFLFLNETKKIMTAQSNSTVKYLHDLSRQIEKFFEDNLQTPGKYKEKVEFKNNLYSAISSSFRNSKMFIVGSSANGFGWERSDVDLCLVIAPEEVDSKGGDKALLQQLSPLLSKKCSLAKCEPIAARGTKFPCLCHRSGPLIHACAQRTTYFPPTASRASQWRREKEMVMMLWLQAAHIMDNVENLSALRASASAPEPRGLVASEPSSLKSHFFARQSAHCTHWPTFRSRKLRKRRGEARREDESNRPAEASTSCNPAREHPCPHLPLPAPPPNLVEVEST
ncbi:hypothetical protein ECG_07982 [Echinococcus granulosus]|nr:hypothetical protein ECG_07982 [Echinococcus granulosus]